MREILFRGKHGEKWAEGSLIVAENFCCILEDESAVHPMDYPYLDGVIGVIDGNVTPVDPATIGQYTGLKDKNGQRIFEGDILKEDYIFSGKHVLHVVAFGESSFGTRRFVSGKLSDCCIPFDDCENPMCTERETEVIGNVYDNPELLQEA